jgi:hypothetical protein
MAGNPNHGSDGKFASSASAAAAVGDHQKAQTPNAGHGHPVTSHAGQKSVGVLSAKEETIMKGQRIDDTHYPPRSNAEATAMTDLSRLQGSQTATKGRFKYQGR